MALRDVDIKITDGGLGAHTAFGEGAHVKIGVSPVVSDVPILINGGMDAKKIKDKLGLSPLADACMDSVENGAATIYTIPVIGSAAGTLSAVVKAGSGTGSAVVSGSPNNAYDLMVVFTSDGSVNEATLKTSSDGGFSYSEDITLPLNGEVVIAGTGVTFTFSAAQEMPAHSFKTGDEYKVTATAPQMSNADILAAIEKLRNMAVNFEFVHIVGPSTAPFWAAVAAQAVTFENVYKKPLMWLLEARNISEGETLDAYVNYLANERKGLTNYTVQVVAARSLYMRMDGTVKDINSAGIVCGLYARAKVQASIGRVDTYDIKANKMMALLPAGIEDYVGVLDDLKYLTFRYYTGIEGVYVTNAKMMCPDGSDYRYAEDVRVRNKLMRLVRRQSLMQLQSDIDMSDIKGSLDAIAKFISAPLDAAVRDGEISSGRIEVPDDQDILATELLKLKIRYVPVGKLREIVIDMGMENPFKA